MLEKQEFAQKVIAEYVVKHGISIPVKIHFVKNINDSWLLYTNNDKVIEQFISQDFSELNGILLPFDGVEYHILIRNDYADYKCTIIHECTHLIDYDDFRVLFNNGNKDIEFHSSYWYMALYSEFHARSIAHWYYYNYLLQQDNIQNEIIQEIINMLPIIQDIEFQLKSITSEKQRQNLWYSLMQYLGRFNSFNIDITKFNDLSDNIKQLYSCLLSLNNEWSDDLFISLSSALKKLSY